MVDDTYDGDATTPGGAHDFCPKLSHCPICVYSILIYEETSHPRLEQVETGNSCDRRVSIKIHPDRFLFHTSASARIDRKVFYGSTET